MAGLSRRRFTAWLAALGTGLPAALSRAAQVAPGPASPAAAAQEGAVERVHAFAAAQVAAVRARDPAGLPPAFEFHPTPRRRGPGRSSGR